MRVAYCTPMRLERDGVGIYSRELAACLSSRCLLEHFPLDNAPHDRSHFRRMAEAVNRCDVLHLEHNFNFFKVRLYPFRDGFRDFMRSVTIPRLVVYHELFDRIPPYVPPAADTALKRARNALVAAAVGAARPLANAVWLPAYNRDLFSLPERVVVHTGFRAEIVRRFAPGARVTVVPHPVYPARTIGDGTSAGLRLPFAPDDVVLTVFGFIERRKDYLGVLEALLRLPPRCKLLVAGGCHDEKESASGDSTFGRMTAFIRAHRLEGRVHLAGFCPDEAIPALMAATDIVVAPFTEDHSSGSINMGLAYSRPVIAYRTLLTEEMNRNGAGLVLVRGREELLSALLRASAEPGRMADAVARGGDYRVRYGFPAAAARFAGMYEEMAGGRAPISP